MKFCKQCGQGNPADAKFCIQCGDKLVAEGEAPVGLPPPIPYQGPAYMQVAPQQQTDGMCIASMVLEILSIWIYPLGIILGVLGIVFSMRGKQQLLLDKSLKGAGFAAAGYVCGIIGTAISGIFWVVIIIAVIVAN
jgi:hypothetical protein